MTKLERIHTTKELYTIVVKEIKYNFTHRKRLRHVASLNYLNRGAI